MIENTETRIDAAHAATGPEGQQYLASTRRVAMRLWSEEQPGAHKAAVRRSYDTIGYVIKGAAELHIGEKMIALKAGDSWAVPADTMHAYRILETFTAIEATSPPAQLAGRDD